MSSSFPSIRTHNVTETLGRFLPSQEAFLFGPEKYKFIAGGFRAGKSRVACTAGLILSALIPGNVGAAFCYRGTDVEARLKPIFDEIIPPSWLKRYNKKAMTYVLRNNSIIMLRHLHDSGAGTNSAAKTRRIGMNLGWLICDQAEELQPEHWNAIISRLSLARAPKKFAFATLNPNGHDWVYEKAFRGIKPWPKDDEGRIISMPDGKFFQELRPEPNVLGIVVNSEENRVSNGGFLEDKYFDDMLSQYDDAWKNRYVYSSFDEFKGKILTGYDAGLTDETLATVHNIQPFPIPAHWELVTGIDVGGDSPWAVEPCYVDEVGNLIITSGFHGRTGRVLEVATWIKHHTPWNENRTSHVIDWENKIASVELADNGIHCRIANKDVLPGLLRMAGYFNVQKNRRLPQWYYDKQPPHKIAKFDSKGSPSIFVFNDAMTERRELDTAKWHPDRPNEMYKSSTNRWDAFEAIRYVCMFRPMPSPPDPGEDKYQKMAALDPMSANEMRDFDRRIAAHQSNSKNTLREMDYEDTSGGSKKYDFAVKEEW